jgi:hypothetical protein
MLILHGSPDIFMAIVLIGLPVLLATTWIASSVETGVYTRLGLDCWLGGQRGARDCDAVEEVIFLPDGLLVGGRHY